MQGAMPLAASLPDSHPTPASSSSSSSPPLLLLPPLSSSSSSPSETPALVEVYIDSAAGHRPPEPDAPHHRRRRVPLHDPEPRQPLPPGRPVEVLVHGRKGVPLNGLISRSAARVPGSSGALPHHNGSPAAKLRLDPSSIL